MNGELLMVNVEERMAEHKKQYKKFKSHHTQDGICNQGESCLCVPSDSRLVLSDKASSKECDGATVKRKYKKPYKLTKAGQSELNELCSELTMFAASQNYSYDSELMTRIYKVIRDIENGNGGEIIET